MVRCDVSYGCAALESRQQFPVELRGSHVIRTCSLVQPMCVHTSPSRATRMPWISERRPPSTSPMHTSAEGSVCWPALGARAVRWRDATRTVLRQAPPQRSRCGARLVCCSSGAGANGAERIAGSRRTGMRLLARHRRQHELFVCAPTSSEHLFMQRRRRR